MSMFPYSSLLCTARINLARQQCICKVCSVKQQQQRSLFPRAHVCVNGHTVVRSVTQFLLTDFCAAGQNEEELHEHSAHSGEESRSMTDQPSPIM